MLLWAQQLTYAAPWSLMTETFWRKYPNPFSDHVITLDVLSRSIDDTGCLRTTRLIGCQQRNAPKWIGRLFGPAAFLAFALENITCDPMGRVMTVSSENLSLSQYLSVREKITYTPCGVQTQVQQDTQVEAHLEKLKLNVLKQKLERFAMDSYEGNAKRGRQGMEWVLERINEPK